MRIPLPILVLFTFLGAGCKKGPDLIGKWNAKAGDKTIEIEFKPDSTYTIGTSKMKAKGEYKLDGEKLTLKPKDVELTGFPASEVEKARAALARVPPTEAQVRFTGNDVVSITGLPGARTPDKKEPPSVDLTRVKE